MTEQPLKIFVQYDVQPSVGMDLGSNKTESIIRDPGGETVDVVDNQTLSLDMTKLINGHLPISYELKEDGTIKGTIGHQGPGQGRQHRLFHGHL